MRYAVWRLRPLTLTVELSLDEGKSVFFQHMTSKCLEIRCVRVQAYCHRLVRTAERGQDNVETDDYPRKSDQMHLVSESDSRLTQSFPVSIARSFRLCRAPQTARYVARAVYRAHWCFNRPFACQPGHRFRLASCHRGRGGRLGRPQYVVRCRHRRADAVDQETSNSIRQNA